MAGNLVVDTINGVDIAVSPPATRAYANSLLAEYEVTGSAVRSIDFSGLDINTHKSYMVEIDLINATATNGYVYCFINNDTVITNYYNQETTASAMALTGTRTNNPSIVYLDASSASSVSGNIFRNYNGNVTALSIGRRLLSATTVQASSTIQKTATVTNITQLTFTSQVASAIGVGSKIRIYRGDV